jgi:CheY-like chemotaxis protein
LDKKTGKGSASVLVVEDEDSVREALSRIIGNYGHRVTTAQDCPEAIKALQNAEFDIVFTDLTLPGPSGWDLVAWLRKNRPGIPVVLLSGWEVPEKDVEKKGPVARILNKPVKLKDMMNTITELVPRLSEEK